MFEAEKYMTTSPWIILAIILVCIVILSTVYGEKIKESVCYGNCYGCEDSRL